MGVYERYVLPHMINMGCGTKDAQKQRAQVVPQAKGRVLEVGIGSGLNLPFYDAEKVEFVWGLEPSEGMRKKARKRVDAAPFEVRWLDSPGEEIPLEDDSADTVLMTYTLCTIPDWHSALSQMRRVLRPGGELIFCEHGLAPDQKVRAWQQRLNPLWGKIGGGCSLVRRIPSLIEEGGFAIETIESGYVTSPKFAGYEYWGTAKQT